MNQTITTQLAHRTIREFTNEPVNKETLDQLFEVAIHAPTSLGMQNASIIHVTDQRFKDELAKIGAQAYVAKAPVYLLFIVDTRRNALIAGGPSAAPYPRNFISGFTDACLMAQNVCVAAESLGLGVNFLGNVHNDAQAVIDLLQLPQLTFPVVGMTLGWPNQDPQLKPRLPRHARVMENGYVDLKAEDLAQYDEVMQTYYDLRDANRRVDSFTDQVKAKFSPVKDLRDATLEIAKQQGFDL